MGLRFGLLLGAVVTVATVAPVNSADTVDFTLPDLQGVAHRLSDYRGKWVVVNYWATWCPPCREELPELEVFHANHNSKDAVVLGINMEELPLAELKSFVEEQFLSYPILREKPAMKTVLGDVPGLPTSYVVSPQGEVVARQVGPVTREMLETFLAEYEREIKVRGGGK